MELVCLWILYIARLLSLNWTVWFMLTHVLFICLFTVFLCLVAESVFSMLDWHHDQGKCEISVYFSLLFSRCLSSIFQKSLFFKLLLNHTFFQQDNFKCKFNFFFYFLVTYFSGEKNIFFTKITLKISTTRHNIA